MPGKTRLVFVLSSLFVSLPLSAGYKFYGASLEEAGWEAVSSPLRCILRHSIPEYGVVEFSHASKSPGMFFSVKVNLAPKKPANARLLSQPAEWQHFDKGKDLGDIPVVVSQTPFYLNNGWARRLLAELEEGKMLRLTYQDWADGKDEINVRISSIDFHQAWGEFQACQQGLLNYNFDDVRHSVFMFDVNQTRLNADALRRLDQVSQYYKVDPAIRQIRIDGYTDSKGFSRINIVVARRRAKAVRDYLVSKGIPAKKIKSVAHHEKEARFSNRTAAGRKKNRRVEVTLIR